jgi:creatinine amidohydrolase
MSDAGGVIVNLLWGECTWEQIAQAAKEDYIIILPLGAIEQHGPMLPVDVDARLAERYAVDSARRAREEHGLNVLVLPNLPYGQSCFHMKFPGTISFRYETYIAAIYDILRTVVDWGFRTIFISNGNGGNEASIDVATHKLMEELTRENSPARVYGPVKWENPNWQKRWRQLAKDGLLPEETFGIHAAMTETAEMLADRPHLVVREKMVKAKLKRTSHPGYVCRTDELSETGAFGDPSLATPELGEALWKAFTATIVDELVRISEETGSGRKR